MINDPNILKEIEEISPLLARLQGENVFKVPEGYFSGLSEKLLELVNYSAIPTNTQNNTQEVPNGYFENLSTSIMQRIRKEPLNEESGIEENELVGYPVLMVEGKQNVFTVPKAYFDNLSEVILNGIRKEEKAKVVSIFAHKVWRYAAAAVITIGIFTTTYFVFIKQNNENNGFAVVNKNTVPDPAALKYNSTKAFNEGIASLSDDEIVGYLENHGNILDNDLLIKNIDTDELPDVTDYLISDEALTNYLEKINNKDSQKQ